VTPNFDATIPDATIIVATIIVATIIVCLFVCLFITTPAANAALERVMPWLANSMHPHVLFQMALSRCPIPEQR
jgi:hypothetical protein